MSAVESFAPLLILKLVTLSLLITRLCVSVGARLGLVDKPSARKQHQGEVPLTGGIAVFTTVLVGTWALGIEPFTSSMLFIACAVFAVGVFDDVQHIRASMRLLLGFASGVLLATLGHIAILNVGNLLGTGDIRLL